MRIGLVGNPNCGKSTVFNALTGARQRVGNWPGVTVECKTGVITVGDKRIQAVDLPGIYTLVLGSLQQSLDERVAAEYVFQQEADLLVNIIDAAHLERHLYLTRQLLEMQMPLLVVLNMMDVAKQRGIEIDVPKLQQELGCPVIVMEAHRGKGVQDLKTAIIKHDLAAPKLPAFDPGMIAAEQKHLSQLLQQDFPRVRSDWIALHLLEHDRYVERYASPAVLAAKVTSLARIHTALQEDADILIADARYRWSSAIVKACVQTHTTQAISWTKRLDSIILHRVLGLPIFFCMMYLLFFIAMNIGGAFQDSFDIASDTIFVGGFTQLLLSLHTPAWLIAILADGAGRGINTTVTFIPVMAVLFFGLSALEDSGYMARAAFVVDRLMRALGLPGKALVPMIVGLGCNVPAVMAARTLEHQRDRILTILMTPFMSCGARLAIYAVFVAAFFPRGGGQNWVFALYAIGMLIAVFTGWLLRHTILPGDPAPLLMELPPYHVPRFRTLCFHAWLRLRGFIKRAGQLIVPICLLLGVLNTIHLDGSLSAVDGDTNTLLANFGRWLTPLFSPMGLQADNWPATVGLLTGVLAKEVVIGTLNGLYSQVGHLAISAAPHFDLMTGLSQAMHSIPDNLRQLSTAFYNPLIAEAPMTSLSTDVSGELVRRFDGQAGAFAYLLFVLLYVPCVSTVATVARELRWPWAVFSVCWSTGLAYAAAVVFYQAATQTQHFVSSWSWVLGVLFVLGGFIGLMRRWGGRVHEFA